MKNIENTAGTKIFENLQTNIRLCRIAQGLTQKELSEKAGVAIVDIIKLEAGKSNITLKTLIKLSIGLNTHWLFLLSGKDEISAMYDARITSKNSKDNLVNDININAIRNDKIEFKKFKNYCKKIVIDKYSKVQVPLKYRLSNSYIAIKLGLELFDTDKYLFSESLGNSLSKLISKTNN